MPLFILMGMICFFWISEAEAQRILLVEKPGSFKNHKYFAGDDITIRAGNYDRRISGIIDRITDTSLLIDYDKDIMINDIDMVLKHRYWMGLLSKATRIAGAGYFALDVINNIITGNPTIVNETTVIISAGLVAFSYTLVPVHYKRMKLGKPWRFSVLNMSMDNGVPNPFLR